MTVAAGLAAQRAEPINQVTERPTAMPLHYEIRSDVVYVRITDVLDAGVSRRAEIFSVPTKSAALVSSAWMFGVVRQWASVRGEENLETRPFYSEVEARRWLSEPGEGNA